MTKKHFELIASVLNKYWRVADSDGQLLVRYIAYSFAHELETENPRFDRDKFMEAVTAS